MSLSANGKDIVDNTLTITETTEIKAAFERIVSNENYRIKVFNATCPGSNDGEIEISLSKVMNYTLTVSSDKGYDKTERITTNSYTLRDLSSGVYRLCFTIEGINNYQQCFDVTISQPQELSVFKAGETSTRALYALGGGKRYSVTCNGKTVETTAETIEVPLRRGRNVIRITADSQCQGIYEEIVYSNRSNGIILFPNPTTGYFSMVIPGEDKKVTVEIITLNGVLLSKKEMEVQPDRLVSMNISSLSNGIYLVKINGETIYNVVKVIKR